MDMDDKTKLYVFARKEALLILLFFIVASFISFLFGMAVGQNLSFGLNNFTLEEKRMVDELAEKNASKKSLLDLQSGEEEEVNKMIEKQNANPEVNTKVINQRLEEEITQEVNGTQKANIQIEPEKKSLPTEKEVIEASSPYSGKYTIVVGSYRSSSEAQEFAAGFKARGYQPIINQIDVPEKGTRFRVSLGLFNNVTEAKEYMRKEQDLFQGQDSFFYKFE